MDKRFRIAGPKGILGIRKDRKEIVSREDSKTQLSPKKSVQRIVILFMQSEKIYYQKTWKHF